eukprot:COSAG01_NODE_10953_length_2039_cov_118.840722_2_plen_131_part_00
MAFYLHFDRNRDGYIQRLELLEGLKALEIPVSDGDSFMLMQVLDKDADGKLSKQEFLAEITGPGEITDASPPQITRVKSAAGGEQQQQQQQQQQQSQAQPQPQQQCVASAFCASLVGIVENSLCLTAVLS